MPKLAVLGCGKMGEALVAGLLASGWRQPVEIVVTARRSEDGSKELSERTVCETTLDNAAAVAGAEVVVIAVKPQDIDACSPRSPPTSDADHTILSIVAAIPTVPSKRSSARPVPVVRAMPNTPSVVHEGMAGIAAGRHADDDHLKLATEVLEHVGRVVTVPENYLDAVTAISGSGPAYFASACRSDDRGGDPPRALARDLDPTRGPNDAWARRSLLRDTQCTRSSCERWLRPRAARRPGRSRSSSSPGCAPRS